MMHDMMGMMGGMHWSGALMDASFSKADDPEILRMMNRPTHTGHAQ
jgi:hypothetical protein